MTVAFTKYEGLGNDFIVVEADVGVPQATAMCDRHLGIGADGVLMTGVAGGRPFMRVINADGSAPEMCGNGLRCVALHLSLTGAVSGDVFEVDTDAGPHRCRVLPGGLVEVQMAVPVLEASSIPVAAADAGDAGDAEDAGDPGDGAAEVIDAPWDVDGLTLRVTCVSMGNPHVVTFDDVGDTALTLGPRLEADPRFPARVNVGFATMPATGGLDLAVYERGVGWTRACGTGACAAAVAAVETGRAPRGVALEVRLPGGALVIEVGTRGERVSMTGPARRVFTGTLGAP